MNFFKKLFSIDDGLFKRRKVENGPEVIHAVKAFSGYTSDELANLCDVSKTMISHWGNPSKPESQPTYLQIEPMLKKFGVGRFNVILEPSPAAIQCNDRGAWLIALVVLILVILSLWFFSWKPCSDNWSQCKKLKWYEMPFYEPINLKEDIQEFKKFKLLQNK